MQQKNFVCDVLKNCSTGKVMKVPSDQIASPTYTKDLAEAFLQLVLAKVCGVINVVGPELINRFSFALEVAKILGVDSSKIIGCCTADICPLTSRPLSCGLKVGRLCTVLPNFSMRTVSDALHDWNPRPQSFYSSTQASGLQQIQKVWYAPHTFQAYWEEEIQAVERCLRRCWLAPGPLMAEFESQVAGNMGSCAILVLLPIPLASPCMICTAKR